MSEAREQQKAIGFVPTMGALHEGHLSLIKQSLKENSATVCSIFVNPVQFNDPQDYKLYPRNFGRDIAMLEDAGCDILFLPTEEEMYPDPTYRSIAFDPGPLGGRLEGAHRPGHFQGVAAVVKRFFDIIKPDRAYFGQKDYQQFLIVKKLVDDYQIPVELVLCPILREPGGLAMSSRNERLSPEQRKHAAVLYKVLEDTRERIAQGAADAGALKAQAGAEITADGNFTLDYFDICSAFDLQRVEDIQSIRPLLVCVAATIGNVRLIDNVLVD